MAIVIKTSGRSDAVDLFTKSGIFKGQKLDHHPFLAFIPTKVMDGNVEIDHLEVKIIKTSTEMLQLPDETDIMVQWPGQYRSDFFRFKVGDYKNFLAQFGV